MCYEYGGTHFCEQCADKEIRRLEKMGVPESTDSSQWPKRVGYGENAKKYPIFCAMCGEYLPYKLTPQGVAKAVDRLATMVQFRTEADGSFGIQDYRDTARWMGDEPWPLHMANALLNQRLGPGQAFVVRSVRGKMQAAMRRRASQEATHVDASNVNAIREAAEHMQNWFVAPENQPVLVRNPFNDILVTGLDRLPSSVPGVSSGQPLRTVYDEPAERLAE